MFTISKHTDLFITLIKHGLLSADTIKARVDISGGPIKISFNCEYLSFCIIAISGRVRDELLLIRLNISNHNTFQGFFVQERDRLPNIWGYLIPNFPNRTIRFTDLLSSRGWQNTLIKELYTL